MKPKRSLAAFGYFFLFLVTPAYSQTVDSFNPGANNTISCVAIQADGKVLIGGAFSNLGGQGRSHIGRVNADGTLDMAFNPGANGEVVSIGVQTNNNILVGGAFSILAGVACTNIGRLNPDGTLDQSFNAMADSSVLAMAVQADGKILVGGAFTNINNQAATAIARLYSDGRVDTNFYASVAGPYRSVWALAILPDDRILVGGYFTNLCGAVRNGIGRLNSDGTLDDSFTPGFQSSSFVSALATQADGKVLACGENLPIRPVVRLSGEGSIDTSFNPVTCVLWSGFTNFGMECLAVQADGKILLGGEFTNLCGQARNNIGRLNADGTLDTGFNPGAGGGGSHVYSLNLQADGKVLVGGLFGLLGGQSRAGIGRITNSIASQTLAFDGTNITWLRGGSSPEVFHTSYESTTNGSLWSYLGDGQRINGGWQLNGPAFPTPAIVRARGFVEGGRESSTWFVETTTHVVVVPIIPPVILVNDPSFGYRSNIFGFSVSSSTGQRVVVEASTNFEAWSILSTNVIGNGPSFFQDPQSTNYPRRFYRGRLQ